MKVEFLSSFNKDLNKLSSTPIRRSVKRIIVSLESAKQLSEIASVKKLHGFSSAYRIRLGDYRIGFFFENKIILLARIAHRKDIYKLFP